MDPAAETFGLAASSLSRRFKRASAKKLAELTERDPSAYDLVALFLDGKTFGDDPMFIGTVCLIGLGVTLEGQKVVLGFVSRRAGTTENERSCSAFLRGLKIEAGLLCVIDGAEGLPRRETRAGWGCYWAPVKPSGSIQAAAQVPVIVSRTGRRNWVGAMGAGSAEPGSKTTVQPENISPSVAIITKRRLMPISLCRRCRYRRPIA
ncbi:MAG: hypothetical protein IID40_01730 [Planctomycetes bacterium]|nr:hypothetical protein [Planctomycetota bacterium]